MGPTRFDDLVVVLWDSHLSTEAYYEKAQLGMNKVVQI
jgi:hypothetical protein